jgi:hypothetical protein
VAYLTLDDLTETECRLIEAVINGEPLDLVAEDEEVTPRIMADWGETRTVRGEVVRQILLGRFGWPDSVQPDPRGVWLRGARLAGGLDLAEVESRLPLRLIDCHATELVQLTGSRLSTVDLSGFVGTSIVAHEANIERSLLLIGARLTCTSPHGTVNLFGAQVGAVLDFSGSHLINTHPQGPALHANNLRTGGGVFLNRGFRAEGGGTLGTIRLSGAVIAGQLNLTSAWIANPEGPALVADYLETRSNVLLNHGFRAHARHSTGTVRLVGARIGGRLLCEGGQAHAIEPADLALNFSQTHVAGDVLLPTSFAVGMLMVTGLTYGGMTRHATLAEWLDMLASKTSHYTSQPYFQLAAAHRAAGHERDVRRIHLARQRDLLRRGELDFLGRLWHRITGLTVGYGYRPAVALLWWVGAVLVSVLLIAGVAGPAGLTTRVNTSGQPQQCSVVEQVGLALNTATPLVKPDSQQRCQLDANTGLGQIVVAGTWFLQVLAWAFVTLFVAGFTGLVRKSP